ncbi:serine hydrolase domain-containing protein [Spirosoma jeollabukense]
MNANSDLSLNSSGWEENANSPNMPFNASLKVLAFMALYQPKLPTLLAFLLLCFPFVSHAQTPSFISDSLDRYVQKGMQNWQIPSMAVGIVQDGKIIISKGYGVRELGTAKQVDENTLFPIASNTKLFVATAFAHLAHQKKLNLDDPVVNYLPSFKMYDAQVTPLLSIRDLLSHRLGLAGHKADFVAWNTSYSRSQLTQKLAQLKPDFPFRQQFGYSNLGYVAAGEVMASITGNTWEHEVDNLLLKPLGMQRTYFDLTTIRDSNVAKPYSTCCTTSDQPITLPYDSLGSIGAATGMVSCLKDMNTWMLMQLDSGRYQQKSVVPWETIAATRQPNTIASTSPIPGFPIESQFYALGVSLLYYAGHQVFLHTGTSFGYRSAYCIVPDKKVAFFIFSSNDLNTFYEALLFQLLDSYLGQPYTNRADYFFKGYQRRQHNAKEILTMLDKRVSAAKQPPFSINSLKGTYHNPLYGNLTITTLGTGKGKTNILVRFEHHPSLTAQLDYMDGNEFRMTFSNVHFGITPATISVSLSGVVNGIAFAPSDFLDDDVYKFTKK